MVTLAGRLGWRGLLIFITDPDTNCAGVVVVSIPPTNVLYGLTSDQMSPAVEWITPAIVVGVFAAYALTRDTRTRAAGLSTPPHSDCRRADVAFHRRFASACSAEPSHRTETARPTSVAFGSSGL